MVIDLSNFFSQGIIREKHCMLINTLYYLFIVVETLSKQYCNSVQEGHNKLKHGLVCNN